MNLCYLSLGSNQKSPERQIRQAMQSLRHIPFTSVLNISNLFWNKAWGAETQQDFCNVMVEITTRLSPVLLLNFCKAIEKKQGRIRKKPWGPRTLDIDIILYSDRNMNTPMLSIPHPQMLSRDFVLKPLLEINPRILLTLSKGSTTL